jgi:hypothetical protein
MAVRAFCHLADCKMHAPGLHFARSRSDSPRFGMHFCGLAHLAQVVRVGHPSSEDAAMTLLIAGLLGLGLLGMIALFVVACDRL